MCGIAGALLPPGGSPGPRILSLMAHRLHHRGPDGSGIIVQGSCGLVHTRLAILDPERGKQPLSTPRQDAWITFNGEIYNSPQLRKDLQANGYRFRTTTDTEVILNLYKHDPEGFVEKLEGIFAFAIWDAIRQELVLARDYIGVKPLYLYEGPELLVFGSEVKAILADPQVPCEPDRYGLMEILSFQNTYGSRTCFRDIRLLEGGEILRARSNGIRRSRRFWTFQPPDTTDISYPEATEKARDLCETVIQDQLLSDVPVASYLSGGMDTGLITAVASRKSTKWLTFSGGFDLQGVPEQYHGHDEREAALSMSRLFGTTHSFTEIRPSFLEESFEKILWHLEEPRGSTCYAPWTMAQKVGSQVKVVLSGHGGDELFAGYRARYQLAGQHESDWESFWYKTLNYLVPEARVPQVLHPDFATPDLRSWPRDAYHQCIKATQGMEAQSRAQHHDLFVYMQGLLLIEDKLSMAHSLESRVPLLDRRLFHFAWTLPQQWKLGTDLGKRILRDAFQPILPQEILKRDKMGFGPPDEHYYRDHLRHFFNDLLLNGSLAKRGLIQKRAIKQILKRQQKGESLAGALWTFASLELWHRSFIDRAAELRALPGSPVELKPIQVIDDPGTKQVA